MVLFATRGFALDRVAGAARAGAERTAALDHEVRDYPVERQPVVKTAFRQFAEVGHRARCLLVVELDGHVAFLGMNDSFGHVSWGFG